MQVLKSKPPTRKEDPVSTSRSRLHRARLCNAKVIKLGNKRLSCVILNNIATNIPSQKICGRERKICELNC